MRLPIVLERDSERRPLTRAVSSALVETGVLAILARDGPEDGRCLSQLPNITLRPRRIWFGRASSLKW